VRSNRHDDLHIDRELFNFNRKDEDEKCKEERRTGKEAQTLPEVIARANRTHVKIIGRILTQVNFYS
jgi:hypothetical protein